MVHTLEHPTRTLVLCWCYSDSQLAGAPNSYVCERRRMRRVRQPSSGSFCAPLSSGANAGSPVHTPFLSAAAAMVEPQAVSTRQNNERSVASLVARLQEAAPDALRARHQHEFYRMDVLSHADIPHRRPPVCVCVCVCVVGGRAREEASSQSGWHRAATFSYDRFLFRNDRLPFSAPRTLQGASEDVHMGLTLSSSQPRPFALHWKAATAGFPMSQST
jgi:hypothetical protein